MNLPKIEPIVWQKKQETKAEVIPEQTQYMPIPPPDYVRHEYIAADGILYTHYPGLPELTNNN